MKFSVLFKPWKGWAVLQGQTRRDEQHHRSIGTGLFIFLFIFIYPFSRTVSASLKPREFSVIPLTSLGELTQSRMGLKHKSVQPKGIQREHKKAPWIGNFQDLFALDQEFSRLICLGLGIFQVRLQAASGL